MKQVTTYVGIDAHKKDLFVAPVTWQLANEPQAVRSGESTHVMLSGGAASAVRIEAAGIARGSGSKNQLDVADLFHILE
jgi:hypothetical protein